MPFTQTTPFDQPGSAIVRLYAGLLLGGIVGTLLGVAVSWSTWTRRIIDLPLQFVNIRP